MKFMLGSLMILLISMLTAPALTALLATRDKEVQAVAEPLVDTLLEGFNQGNYAQYSRDFDDTLREAIPEKKFQQVRADILKKLGKFKEKNIWVF